MIDRLRSMLSQVLYTPSANAVQSTTVALGGGNSYENPFLQISQGRNYAVNKPVKGGYFAGYYNGQANIVGRKLFIEA